MNNKNISRNKLENSNLDNSSSHKSSYPPDVFINPRKFKDTYIYTNLFQDISHKETEIYKSFRKNFGKNFFDMKPTSLLLFEKRLKDYFLATNFLGSFIRKNSINFDEKINMGSLDFYALSDKNYKNDIMTSVNNEKILTMSKNFSLQHSKDVISREVFKMKYQKKNAKRIVKILNNKKNKNTTLQLKSNINDFNYNDDLTDIKKLELNKHFLEKRRESENITRNHSGKNNNLNLNINIDSFRKLNKHNSLDIKSKKSLANLEIFEYTNKKESKTKKNYWLNTSNINSNTNINNKIISTILRKKNSKNNLTEYNKSKKKKIIYSRNVDISFYMNKYKTYSNNNTDRNIGKKNNNLFLLDFGKIKKLSKKFKININNNINGLNDYTKQCKSKLLRLLFTNNIDKKIYLIKKENKAELNELKDLLFNNNSDVNNHQKYNENTKSNTLKNDKDKLSKTTYFKTQNNYFNNKEGKINNRIINLEIQEIIKKANENLRKKINIKKVREKCKENYKTIIKLRENIKYKNDRLNQELKKLKTKK